MYQQSDDSNLFGGGLTPGQNTFGNSPPTNTNGSLGQNQNPKFGPIPDPVGPGGGLGGPQGITRFVDRPQGGTSPNTDTPNGAQNPYNPLGITHFVDRPQGGTSPNTDTPSVGLGGPQPVGNGMGWDTRNARMQQAADFRSKYLGQGGLFGGQGPMPSPQNGNDGRGFGGGGLGGPQGITRFVDRPHGGTSPNTDTPNGAQNGNNFSGGSSIGTPPPTQGWLGVNGYPSQGMGGDLNGPPMLGRRVPYNPNNPRLHAIQQNPIQQQGIFAPDQMGSTGEPQVNPWLNTYLNSRR